MQTLLLMITSAKMLEKGTFPRCKFDMQGGGVGSSVTMDWCINNYRNEIEGCEFKIKYYENSYCITAYTNNIFINKTKKNLPQNILVKLKDADLITLHNYDIRVKIYGNYNEDINFQDDVIDIINREEVDLLSTKKNHLSLPDSNYKLTEEYLLTINKNNLELDPLALLKTS